MKITQGFKSKLSLSKDEKNHLEQLFGINRLIWNTCLAYKKELWETYNRRNPCIDNPEELKLINKCNYSGFKNPYYWQLYDNNPQTTEAIGFIGEGGLGSLENTLRISMGLNENYCKQGIGTALMKKFITDVMPPEGGFEAKGYMPGSRKFVKKLGFQYIDELDTFVYKRKN